MIEYDLSNNDYHKLPSISKSGLDRIAQSPKHYKDGGGSISNETKRIGTVTHSNILEDGKGLILIPDTWGRQSKDDRASWKDWFADNGADIDTTMKAGEWHPEFERQTGLVIAAPQDMEMCRNMHRSIADNNDAADLLSDGVAEASIFQTYEGVDCRIRPDWMRVGNHTLVDVKSTPDASERPFASSCAKFRYHVQAAFYSTIYHLEFGYWPDFKFIALEKTAPYTCAVYQLNEIAMENGTYLMNRDLETYRECVESGEWPGVPNNLDLSIPIWDKPDDWGGFDTVDNFEELVA